MTSVNMTVAQLKEKCRDLGIKGYSKMKKAELIKMCLSDKSSVVKKNTKPLKEPKRKNTSKCELKNDELKNLQKICYHIIDVSFDPIGWKTERKLHVDESVEAIRNPKDSQDYWNMVNKLISTKDSNNLQHVLSKCSKTTLEKYLRTIFDEQRDQYIKNHN